mgnify:FL=1
MISLSTLDMLWMRHIDELKDLRDAVSLSGYGQRNPLIEYQNQAYTMFEELMDKINGNTVRSLLHVKINVQIVKPPAPVAATTNTHEIDANTEESALAPQKGSINMDEIGRNDPCPCGSGQKFKKCHGA